MRIASADKATARRQTRPMSAEGGGGRGRTAVVLFGDVIAPVVRVAGAEDRREDRKDQEERLEEHESVGWGSASRRRS